MKIAFSAALVLALAAPARAQAPKIRSVGISEAVDSAAAVAALRALPSTSTRSGEWMFALNYATTGALDSVTLMYPNTAPRELLDSVIAVLRRSARVIHPSDSTGLAGFVALPGDGAVIRRPTEEAPRVVNTAAVQRVIGRAVEALRKSAPERFHRGTRRTIVVGMSVDTAGRPQSIRLESRSGDPMLDEQAVRSAASFRFEPAKVEGRPVRALVKVPVNFAF